MACDTVTWPQTDHKAQPQSDRSPMLWLTASATAASSVDRFNKDSTEYRHISAQYRCTFELLLRERSFIVIFLVLSIAN